jgi:hypothetical protein
LRGAEGLIVGDAVQTKLVHRMISKFCTAVPEKSIKTSDYEASGIQMARNCESCFSISVILEMWQRGNK